MPPLILASSSPYRKQLLQRLALSFSCISPDIDETPYPQENAQQLVLRLAQQKAQAIANGGHQGLIIASDQVATLNGNILGKPGNHANACRQLQQCSGQAATFYTSLHLLNSQSAESQQCVETYTVYFRELNAAQIERYLIKEQPYQCAGSFKMEGLGICLFEKLQGDDPNSLIGLPLIQLISMLANEGIPIP
ncbi:Maf family nucleotide pyrophosphatase [Dasania sp. GY-MA-18]|uniref:7-methyl-GTP pyrophosphatase n=1 Tax=Dasania phycosphaerae TaxID=2950436 RepID=A0A9J6RJ14_9GAMM|nr:MULTISPECIES: Maf family protein [Dasania]MCR8921950.1 Maf family nucleotide pyrophosphatase [Dasania sp. GY-MA-18]MCZ0864378.1 Maf family protein [Dasania phycosphaerae]MCZ0868106.1 Maf family protein [Dasania phycosphaerae]